MHLLPHHPGLSGRSNREESDEPFCPEQHPVAVAWRQHFHGRIHRHQGSGPCDWPCVGPVQEYPEHPAMANAPNGKHDALIPAASWRKAFSTAAKVTKKQKSVLRSVAVKLGDQLATFGATDGDSCPVEQTRVR